MKEHRSLKCLNKLTLQGIAMAAMALDHIGAALLPEVRLLRCIGRPAFPVFAFFIAEGFARTRSFRNYLLRMAAFAAAAEIPFNLVTGGSLWDPAHQNVLLTFCIALLCLRWLEHLRGKHEGSALWALDILLVCCAGFLAGNALLVDYYGFGVLTVIVFYLSRGQKRGWLTSLLCLVYINWIALGDPVCSLGLPEIPLQSLALLALPLLWLYNGKPGRQSKTVRYACYAFYPAHLLVLGLLARFLR